MAEEEVFPRTEALQSWSLVLREYGDVAEEPEGVFQGISKSTLENQAGSVERSGSVYFCELEVDGNRAEPPNASLQPIAGIDKHDLPIRRLLLAPRVENWEELKIGSS